MANQNQINDLLTKKIQGAPFTDINQPASLEAAGSSQFKVQASNIWSQTVPSTAPSYSTGTTLPTGGTKYVSSTSYIVYYDKVILSSVNAGISYRYAGTNPIDVLNTNILINAIPFNQDPAGSYNIKVYDGTTLVPSNGSTPWYFDGASGYLTFYTSISFTPSISFWRYEGTMGTSSVTSNNTWTGTNTFLNNVTIGSPNIAIDSALSFTGSYTKSVGVNPLNGVAASGYTFYLMSNGSSITYNSNGSNTSVNFYFYVVGAGGAGSYAFFGSGGGAGGGGGENKNTLSSVSSSITYNCTVGSATTGNGQSSYVSSSGTYSISCNGGGLASAPTSLQGGFGGWGAGSSSAMGGTGQINSVTGGTGAQYNGYSGGGGGSGPNSSAASISTTVVPNAFLAVGGTYAASQGGGGSSGYAAKVNGAFSSTYGSGGPGIADNSKGSTDARNGCILFYYNNTQSLSIPNETLTTYGPVNVNGDGILNYGTYGLTFRNNSGTTALQLYNNLYMTGGAVFQGVINNCLTSPIASGSSAGTASYYYLPYSSTQRVLIQMYHAYDTASTTWTFPIAYDSGTTPWIFCQRYMNGNQGALAIQSITNTSFYCDTVLAYADKSDFHYIVIGLKTG